MSIVSDLKNPFGIVDNKLVHIKDIEKGTEIYCPICKDRLIVRQGEQMVKHLSHKNNTDTGCSGESVIHKLTKEYLYQELKSLKIQEHKIDVIKGKFKLSEAEELDIKYKYLEYRDLSPQYIPDVFVILEGNYRIGLEVCYKNPKDISYLQELLPNLPIDIVLQIQVNEEDLVDLNLNELISRANVIYNRLLGGFTKAHDKMIGIVSIYNEIINSKKNNKPLEVLEKIKLKNELTKVRKETKELEEILDLKNKEINRLRNNNGYYREFSNCRKSIRELYKVIYKDKGLSLSADAKLCGEAIIEIGKEYDILNKKITILADGIWNINKILNNNKNSYMLKEYICNPKYSNRFNKIEDGIEKIVRDIKDNSHQEIIRKYEKENK